MLDDLRTALPNTVFYVQSVLPATQEKVADSLPGLAPDRLAVINAAIQQLCAERGCYYLDLSAEFADDAGYLSTEFSQPDGVHLTVSGYSRWVSYLCTHVPYSKDNPYQAGSTYYLSDDMKKPTQRYSVKEPHMPNDNEHPRYTDPEHPYSGSGRRYQNNYNRDEYHAGTAVQFHGGRSSSVLWCGGRWALSSLA